MDDYEETTISTAAIIAGDHKTMVDQERYYEILALPGQTPAMDRNNFADSLKTRSRHDF